MDTIKSFSASMAGFLSFKQSISSLRSMSCGFLSILGLTVIPLVANAAIVTEEYEKFYLKYDDTAIAEYGTPIVGGDTVFFLPTDMSIQAQTGFSFDSGTDANSWTTSFAVIPKTGYLLDGFRLTEQGDYSNSIVSPQILLDPSEIDKPSTTFRVEPRLFIRDINNPSVSDFMAFNHSFTEADSVSLAFWEASEDFSTTEFQDGYWLTVQNNLFIDELSFSSNPFGESNYITESAFIQKKFVGFDLNIIETPILPSFWLFLSAMTALIYRSRKS